MRAVLLVVVGVILSACVSVAPPAATQPTQAPAFPIPYTLPPVTLPPVTLPPIVTLPPVVTPPPIVTLPPVVTAPPPTPTMLPTPTDEPAPTSPVTPDPNATPAPTRLDVLPYLTSEVTVVNLADAGVEVTVTLVDADSADEFEIGTFELAPLQVTSQAVVPARYRLDFNLGGGNEETCTIDIGDEELQFAVIESGIAITTSGAEPDDPAEMVVATSSRCQAGLTT
jgi:hypothetical protein